MPFLSPLRYPGGKRRLVNFVKTIIQQNDLLQSTYVEPYAGGASIGIALLLDGYVTHIHINDLDRSVYAFWYSVLYKTNELIRLIRDTPITMNEWYRQQKTQARAKKNPLLELGFSTFFLNRTNRSGIISGGVIGGKNQNGDWKLDCRFNKTELIQRIERIAEQRKNISLHNLDASVFIKTVLPTIEVNSLVYFDPPYYVQGQQLLYVNFYKPKDHRNVAARISKIKQPWIISYDDVPEVRLIYQNYRSLSYKLHYAAQSKYIGKEVLFFSKNLVIPKEKNPQNVVAPKLAIQV